MREKMSDGMRIVGELLKGDERLADNLNPEHCSISKEEGEFLQRLIAGRRPEVSLEVGLAYGVSAIFICEALVKAGGRRHIVLDPHQEKGWNGIGLRNLEAAGFGGLVEFRARESQMELPELVREGVRVDFAFIDGWHTFDHTLVDFFFIDRLLSLGGIVTFDDVTWPAVHRVCRFVAINRSYRVCGEIGGTGGSGGRAAVGWLAKQSPQMGKVLHPRFAVMDEELGFYRDSTMVAFEKVGEDTRGWDFEREF
jgi:predicted O-methyltransferase YrrM